MNRRSFFKLLGIGAATAVVAPSVLVAEPKRVERTVADWKRQFLIVYEEPHGKGDYSIGVDVGSGLGGDSDPSCVSVMREGKLAASQTFR